MQNIDIDAGQTYFGMMLYRHFLPPLHALGKSDMCLARQVKILNQPVLVVYWVYLYVITSEAGWGVHVALFTGLSLEHFYIKSLLWRLHFDRKTGLLMAMTLHKNWCIEQKACLQCQSLHILIAVFNKKVCLQFQSLHILIAVAAAATTAVHTVPCSELLYQHSIVVQHLDRTARSVVINKHGCQFL